MLHTTESLNVSLALNAIDYVFSGFAIDYVVALTLVSLSTPPYGPMSGSSYTDVAYNGSFVNDESVGCFYRLVSPSVSDLPRASSDWIAADAASVYAAGQVSHRHYA